MKNMSEFSKKCKEIIKRKNTNVYQISKKSNLDRTTLQRMVNGEKKVSRQFVQELCSFLQVSQQEEEELLELWNMERIGEKLYYARREIHKMLKDIQQICDSWNLYKGGMYRIENREEREEKLRVLTMEMDIADAIRCAISEEITTQQEPVISMDYFKNVTYAMQQMIREERDNKKKIQCYQYVQLRAGEDQAAVVENISRLKWILSFAFSFRNCYYPRYAYVNSGSKEEMLQLWPHFLFTTSKIILISAKEDEALVITDPYMISLWKRQLEQKQELYSDLFFYYGSVKPEKGYGQQSFYHRAPLYEVTSHPCIAMLVSMEEMMENQDNAYMKEMLEIHQDKEENHIESICYFGMQGMEEFARTGRLFGMYGDCWHICSEEERKQRLENLLSHLSGEYEGSCLIKDDYQVPDDFYMEVYTDGRLVLGYTADVERYVCVCIEEKGIYEAFYDYLKSLPEEKCVYSVEETKRLMRERVGRMMDEMK